jgi:hypothetical protein
MNMHTNAAAINSRRIPGNHSMRRTYPVSSVKEEKVEDGSRQYLVEWESSRPEGERSWEPLHCLKGSMEFVVRAAKRSLLPMCCRACSEGLLASLEDEEKKIDRGHGKSKRNGRRRMPEEDTAKVSRIESAGNLSPEQESQHGKKKVKEDLPSDEHELE